MGFTLGTKFNEGTDWEFRVSNETIAEVVTGGGITEADIADYCYCAFVDKRVAALVPESTRQSNDGLYPWAQEYCPVYNTNNGSHPSELKMNVDVLDDNKVECYERNILTYYGTISGKTGHFLVMDIHDIKKWIIDCDASGAFSSAAVTSTAGFNGINDTIYLYDTNNVPQVNPLNAPAGTTGGLYPCNIVNIDSTLWVGFFTPIAHSKNLLFNEKLSHAAWEFDYAAGDTFNVNSAGYVYQGDATTLQGWCEFQDLEFPTSSGATTTFTTYIDADGFNVIKISGQYGNAGNPFITYAEMGNMFKTLKAMHTVQSWGGFLFYDNGVTYKPIIEDGIVVGFTSDMDIPSEWDDMTNVTGNNISPTPPTPPTPTPEDDYSDMELGLYNGKMGGLTKFAIMSTQDLVDLIIDYNTNAANAGSNFSNHVVCLYRLGINPALLTTATSGKIVMIKSAGDVDFESQANYSLVSDQATLIDCGSITVPRNTGTFYDFSPYTSYELYIPGCGWIPLPDNVAGRTIRAYIIFDFPSCSAKGIVRISGDGLLTYGTTIATVNGVIGAPVPFTIGENGQQRAGIMSANAQVASGIATGIVGGALGNPYMMVAGGSNLVGGLISAYTAGNTNYVSTKGGAADFSMFGDGGKAILKINAPVIDSVVTKPLFGHTVGYMCNEVGTLSSFHGFTVCSNPHVHINATSAEKEEIKMLLEEGVILP